MASATSDDVAERNSVRSAPLPRVVEGERVVVEDPSPSEDLPEHIYDDSRSRSQFSSAYRRRRRPRVTRSEVDDGNPRREEPERSLPDRITRTALSGTLGVLRQVGGITLSTTGALVAPPLHVTKTILLPQLWAALVDFLSSSSPPRLKDWFRIVQTSVYHVVNTLLHTAAGTTARQHWLIVWNDWMDIMASAPTRQWVVDVASTLIQTAELLESDAVGSVLDQLTVTLCRSIDVVASAKFLVHDGRHALASLAALAADPATTTALAEVTAYICHALEMEDGKRRSTGGDQHRRRRRRQQYTAATMERETLGQRPGMTVEEAILSSLEPGWGGVDDEQSCDPQWDQASSSIRQQLDGTDPKEEDKQEDDFAVQAREDVDMEYLRDAMEERAMRANAKKHEQVQSKEVCDLENVPTTDENDGPKTSRTRKRAVVEPDNDDDVDDEDVNDERLDIPINLRSRHPGRLEGESTLEQFDRVVNEILSQQRQESPPPPREARGSVRRPGKDLLDGWIKKALSRNEPKKQASRGSATVLLIGGTVVATIGLMWFALGCYGLYHLAWPQSQQLGAGPSIAGAGNEIVIRVVKEIVHTTTDGEVLSRSNRDLQSEKEMNSKIVECVANLYK